MPALNRNLGYIWTLLEYQGLTTNACHAADYVYIVHIPRENNFQRSSQVVLVFLDSYRIREGSYERNRDVRRPAIILQLKST